MLKNLLDFPAINCHIKTEIKLLLIIVIFLACESKDTLSNLQNKREHSNVTQKLANFVTDLKFSDLHESTVEKAKWAILDALACGIAGSDGPGVSILTRTLQQIGNEGSTPVFGKSNKYSGSAAAFINGTMICALDFDDTHSFSSVHAGGPVISAALSALFSTEAPDIDGKKFIEAIVAGYDISCRSGMGIRGKDAYARGFHPTAINGFFGAATSSGKILELSRDEIISAWGIAGSSIGGLMSYVQNGALTKKLHSGNAAQAGFMASMLALNKFLGPNDIFEGKYNYPEAYANTFEPDKVLDKLGERYEIARMSYKRFPCCRTIQVPVTAVMEILQSDTEYNPENISKIKAIIANEDIELVLEPLQDNRNPKTVLEAQFSMPFSVALALVEKDISIELYKKALSQDDSNFLVKKLSNLFEYSIDEKYTKQRPEYFPCELQIEFKDGTTICQFIKAPLGDYQNPLSHEEHKKKIVQIVSPIMGNAKTQNLIENILNLENLSAVEIKDLIRGLNED